ncbi:MAG: alpha/beta hydrolase [Acaryochloris sp. SU_5_25]|nr:alpha/beta hydrolase [Acaryochloris sp. SU_5_25]
MGWAGLKRYTQYRMIGFIASLSLAYLGVCLFFFVRQEALLYNPKRTLVTVPSNRPFHLPFQDVTLPVGTGSDYLRGWWIPAPQPDEMAVILPDEPKQIVNEPKVILYFIGRGGNKGSYLPRVEGFHQLGFSVLLVDYRGFGNSHPRHPNESRLYEDSQAAWHYLTQIRNIPAQDIVIYGESLGGAVAVDLAVKQPDASGLIVQSSFTSMPAIVKETGYFRLLPVDWILTQRFNSLAKVRSLKIPVLFLHGTADTVVPSWMSRSLYQATPPDIPKELLFVPESGHFSIYRPGAYSYLRAIQRLIHEPRSQVISR